MWEAINRQYHEEEIIMAKQGKKYQEALKLIEADRFYSPKEAMELVKKNIHY